MILDASALVGILADEPEATVMIPRLLDAKLRLTHPVSFYEAAIALARLKSKEVAFGIQELREFIGYMQIGEVSIGPAETSAALAAFARYGRGRHPAALNMGDCFSYACAKVRGMPLLYKGTDFAQTDLA